MNVHLKYFLFLISFAFVCFVNAQNPSYFAIGEQELENIDIYSILETKNERLYISSSSGIFEYQKTQFKKIRSKTEKANKELFGLVEDQKENIYCFNLAGDIFQIINQELELFTTIPQKYVTNRIQLICNQYGELLFFSKGYCLRINSDGQFDELHKNTSNGHWGWELSQMHNKDIILSTPVQGNYQLLDGKIIKNKNYPNKLTAPEHAIARSFFTIGNDLVCAAKGEFGIANQNEKLLLKNEYDNRFYNITKDQVWGLKSSSGISVFEIKNKHLMVTSNLFEDYFISICFVSESGTIYLGTFGRGMLVIPNSKMVVHNTYSASGKIRDLVVSDSSDIFISEMGVGIKKHKDSTQIIVPEKDKNFNNLYWILGSKFEVNKKHPSLFNESLFEKKYNIFLPAIKDIFPIDSSSFLLATSKGIKLKGDSSKILAFKWIKDPTNPSLFAIEGSGQRCQSIAYDSVSKTIYYASLTETLALSGSEKTQLTFNGQVIICQDFDIYEGQLFCATEKFGVLVYQGSNYIKQYPIPSNDKYKKVSQIEVKSGKLYLIADQKFTAIDLSSNTNITLGINEGIEGQVNKFAISDSHIFFLADHSKILSTAVPIDKTDSISPKIYIDSIKVTDQLITHKSLYAHNENSFSFYVDCRNICLKKEAQIEYRILGFENKWNQKSTLKDAIEYKFLPPGKYTFEVKAIHNGSSSEVVHYSFEIKAPFWMSGWFILLIIGVIFIIFFLFFRLRLRYLRKKEIQKSEKTKLQSSLLEAELRALRSQMNPHFIFNSLHSIQALILNEELENSYDYISLFSKLVRNTLNYSNQEFISVASEIEFLEIYLKLEKLRFGDEFEYEIKCNGETDILIPSLLIQPFVENALIHGLQNKLKDKKLHIYFTTGKEVTCTISDNGIGREASEKIQSRQGKRHQSYAISATQKRFEMYENKLHQNIGFIIIDLKKEEKAIGTKVKMSLPYKGTF